MKHLLRERFANKDTGEIKTVKYERVSIKYPKKGAIGMYIKNVDMGETTDPLVAIAGMTQNEAKVFTKMIEHRNKYNIVKSSAKNIVEEVGLTWSRSYTSQRLKNIRDLNLIRKIGSKIWINPFVIKPKYDEDDAESQWRTQQMWKRMYEDKDTYYEGIDDEIEYIKNGGE